MTVQARDASPALAVVDDARASAAEAVVVAAVAAEAEAEAAVEAEAAEAEAKAEYQRRINAYYYTIQMCDCSASIQDVSFPSTQTHPLLFSLFPMLHRKYFLSHTRLALSNSVASKCENT